MGKYLFQGSYTEQGLKGVLMRSIGLLRSQLVTDRQGTSACWTGGVEPITPPMRWLMGFMRSDRPSTLRLYGSSCGNLLHDTTSPA